jgi:hypothetical protein
MKKFNCNCVYPCSDYPECGGTKISFGREEDIAYPVTEQELKQGKFSTKILAWTVGILFSLALIAYAYVMAYQWQGVVGVVILFTGKIIALIVVVKYLIKKNKI